MAMSCVWGGECCGCMQCLDFVWRGDVLFDMSRRPVATEAHEPGDDVYERDEQL